MSRLSFLFFVLALTVLAYASTWRASFVYEDARTIFGNGEVQQHEPWHLLQLRSLSEGSFLLNHMIDGNNPRGYHAVNVAVHCVNGVLVFVLAWAFLEPLGAAVAMTLFLLAPVQTEAVAYISGRTELLSAFGILLACVLAVSPPRAWHLIAIPGVLLAGLLAKETAAVGFLLVPLVCLQQWPTLLKDLRLYGWLPAMAIFGAIVIGLAGLILWPLRHLDPGTVGSERGVLGFLAIQSTAFWRYLPMVVSSYGQTIDHDFDLIPHALGYAALLGIGGLYALAWKARGTLVGFGLAWTMIAVAPRFMIRIPEFLNEHQLYVPMIGIAFGLGAFMQWAIEQWHPVRDWFVAASGHDWFCDDHEAA